MLIKFIFFIDPFVIVTLTFVPNSLFIVGLFSLLTWSLLNSELLCGSCSKVNSHLDVELSFEDRSMH